VELSKLSPELSHEGDHADADIARLLDLGLVERDAANLLCVPWEEIQIQVTLARDKAA
jgi:hypothetical protein